MPEVTNEHRAEWALVAVKAFAAQTGQIASGDFEHDLQSVLADLLTDVLHLADMEGISRRQLLRQGIGNYREERAEEASEC